MIEMKKLFAVLTRKINIVDNHTMRIVGNERVVHVADFLGLEGEKKGTFDKELLRCIHENPGREIVVSFKEDGDRRNVETTIYAVIL